MVINSVISSGGPRRRSLYNFFLKHQDAVEKPDPSSAATSPVAPQKEFKIQGIESLL